MKVRMFLSLFLSIIMFCGQSRARANDITAENKKGQSNCSPVKIVEGKKWSVKIADSFIKRYPAHEIYDSVYNSRWSCEQGVVLEGLNKLYITTRDPKYLTYIKSNIDMFIGGDGSIRTYNYDDFNLENINTGRQLLFLFSVTKDKKYKIAADTLMKQLKNQPRTKAGIFWRKKIYPSQVWLDGLYMGLPFYSQYSKMFRQTKNYKDIASQFILLNEKARDNKTGLLYHAWDESLQEKWADPNTGKSPSFYAQAIGYYAMALVDVLDFFPKSRPERRELIKILQDLSDALMKLRDENCHLWFQVIDQGARNGNYHEASASCMFGYVFAKGANMGYLDKKYLKYAKETFYGVVDNLTAIDEMGFIDLHHSCREAGLGGGNPYRDGSYEYYIKEAQKTNDLKGLGPFILMSLELEKAKMLKAEKFYPVGNKITKF